MSNWFVTGASRGLGREIARSALQGGHRVVGTSRTVDSLAGLADEFGDAFVPLRLDVTSTASIEPTFERAVEALGGIDVVVNNAGYAHVGALEEMTEAEAREELETLFFGPLFITRAAIRHMRQRGGGDIVQMSSLAGIGGLPGHVAYTAAKWALEGMVEALRNEVADFGIRLLILEPAGFRTSITAGVRMSSPMSEYESVMAAQRGRYLDGSLQHASGNPQLAAQALLELLGRPDMPRRLLMGAQGYEVGVMLWQERIDEAKSWAQLSRSLDDAGSD